MLTKVLVAVALLAGSASLAAASQRTLHSAPVSLGESSPHNSDAWMGLHRRVPGNVGDTSYGGDWAATWGGQ